MLGFSEIFTFSTPAPMGFSFAYIECYATSSLKLRNVRTRMTSFSAKNLSRLKVYIIKRKFNFLIWRSHLFHLVKRENVYFIRGFATHEICIFRFTRWNKWHIHSKNLNILYVSIRTWPILYRYAWVPYGDTFRYLLVKNLVISNLKIYIQVHSILTV